MLDQPSITDSIDSSCTQFYIFDQLSVDSVDSRIPNSETEFKKCDKDSLHSKFPDISGNSTRKYSTKSGYEISLKYSELQDATAGMNLLHGDLHGTFPSPVVVEEEVPSEKVWIPTYIQFCSEEEIVPESTLKKKAPLISLIEKSNSHATQSIEDVLGDDGIPESIQLTSSTNTMGNPNNATETSYQSNENNVTFPHLNSYCYSSSTVSAISKLSRDVRPGLILDNRRMPTSAATRPAVIGVSPLTIVPLHNVSTKKVAKYKTWCSLCKNIGVTYCFDCKRVFCSGCWVNIGQHVANLPIDVRVNTSNHQKSQTGLHFYFHPSSTASLGEVILSNEDPTASVSDKDDSLGGFIGQNFNHSMISSIGDDCSSYNETGAEDENASISFGRFIENKRNKSSSSNPLIVYKQISKSDTDSHAASTSSSKKIIKKSVTSSKQADITPTTDKCFHDSIIESMKECTGWAENLTNQQQIGSHEFSIEPNVIGVEENPTVFIRSTDREKTLSNDVFVREGVSIKLNDAIASGTDSWPVFLAQVTTSSSECDRAFGKPDFKKDPNNPRRLRSTHSATSLAPLNHRKISTPWQGTEDAKRLNPTSLGLSVHTLSLKQGKVDFVGNDLNQDSQYQKYFKLKNNMISMRLNSHNKHTILPLNSTDCGDRNLSKSLGSSSMSQKSRPITAVAMKHSFSTNDLRSVAPMKQFLMPSF